MHPHLAGENGAVRALVLLLLTASMAGCQVLPSFEEDEHPPPPSEAPPPQPPPEKPPLPPFGGAKLLGLTRQHAVELLGEPSALREEAPATVWTYTVDGCRLELFFYYDLQSRRQRSLAYDLRAPQDTEAARRMCLGRIAAGRAQEGENGE